MDILFSNTFANTLIIVGIVFCFLSIFVINPILKWIPTVTRYIFLIQLISVVVLSIGVYLKGMQNTEQKWHVKMLEVQQKINKLERENVDINIELGKKIAEKDKVIYIKGETIYRYIDREVVNDKEVIKFVENCPIPTKILELHNAAANNTPIQEKKQ